MPGPLRWGRSLLIACGLAAFASPAAAYYEESHVTGDEVRLSVDTGGSARVEHLVSWHLVAGQYHFFDLTPGGAAPMAPEPSASVTGEDGKVYSATLVPREGNVLRVVFEEPKGLRHGRYKIRFAYREDWAAAHAFSRDGAMWRLTWSTPSFSDGYDSAKAIFDLPPSVDEPKVVESDVDLGILSTVRRAEDKDELELVKPHVARHEVVNWTIRVAPRAFPGVRDPALRPPPARPPAVAPRATSPLVFVLGALVLGLGYAALARKKGARFEQACRAQGVSALGFVPRLRLDLRCAVAGACLGGGILLETERAPTAGAVGIAVAMLLVALRPGNARIPARGPGRWLAIRASEAFPKVPGDAFDPATLRGAVVALGVFVTLGGVGWGLSHVAPHAPFLVALDSLALLPLVATGRRSQLAPSVRSHASWLQSLFVRLAKNKTLRVAPWARVPTGSAEPDEVRLLAVPRAAMPGLVGIEVGLAFWRAATCYGSTPEVLVRVHESTAASARMITLARFVCPVPGRLPEERVYRLLPRLPTRDGTLRLVERLGRELEDRRFKALPWEQEERRLPPSAHEKPLAHAA
jgi:hypothetical protein